MQGPIFSIIGAWLVYQVQNKGVIDKDVSESMFQKAIITTGLSFILSHFGPIDDWYAFKFYYFSCLNNSEYSLLIHLIFVIVKFCRTHLGAALTGIAYGFLICPTLQLDNASSGSGQDEGVALLRRSANPCKSLVLFAVFILCLGSLLFFMEPPLDSEVPDELLWF